jgi:plasmid maintenance system antidote protein VapI
MTLTNQLIDAIENSGATIYRVAKDSGIPCAIIQRFVTRERGMTLETADKLAAYFGMKLTKPKRVSPT